MKLDGASIQYFLAQEFEDVEGIRLSRSETYDYPIIYDESSDMDGHIVVVPKGEGAQLGRYSEKSLFACVDEDSARVATRAGAPIVLVQGGTTFSELYNALLAVFVRAERLDAKLHSLVDTYAGFQPLLETCSRVMGLSFALVDEQYRVVCQASGTTGSPSDDMLEPEAIDLFMASSEYRRMRASRRVFAIPGSSDLFVKNVFSGNHLVGSLIARHAEDTLSARYAQFLLNYLGPFVDEMYARVGSFDLHSLESERVRAALRSTISGDAAGPVSLAAALADCGHNPLTRYVMLRIERSFTNESEAELGHLTRRLELALPHAYCFSADQELFMLVDVGSAQTDQDRFFFQILPLAARDNLAKIGVSRTFADMSQLAAACEQANIALAQGNESDPTYWSYYFDNYALSWLLARATADKPLACLLHPAIAILEDYDRDHDSELLKTLVAFMHNRYNATAAAKELFVARSTLLNRLDRIVELTQLDFDNSRDQLYLALSLEIEPRSSKEKALLRGD